MIFISSAGNQIVYTSIQMSLIPFSKHDVASYWYLFSSLIYAVMADYNHHYIHSDGTLNTPLIYQ